MQNQNKNHNQNTNLNQNQNVNSEHTDREEAERRIARHLAGLYLALAREQLLLARVERRRCREAANMCDRLREVWAKELALDREKDYQEKLTLVGKQMWGEDFELERPDSELK